LAHTQLSSLQQRAASAAVPITENCRVVSNVPSQHHDAFHLQNRNAPDFASGLAVIEGSYDLAPAN
jgi:hypothetical protein